MTAKRITLVLLALAACCAVAACTNPTAPEGSGDPSSALATPVSESQTAPAPEPEPDPDPETETKEEPPMERIVVADAACYRGTVASIDTDLTGAVMYRLTAFPGTGLAEQLMVVFTQESRASFDPSSIQEGDHLEVFYSPAGGETCGLTCYDVIAANRLLPAEGVYYNGILVEAETQENGSVDLVMVPQGTPLESWGDPMQQFVFHTGPDTRFRMSSQDLEEGMLLNIYHKGIATRSIPPQGEALEVRPMAQESVSR